MEYWYWPIISMGRAAEHSGGIHRKKVQQRARPVREKLQEGSFGFADQSLKAVGSLAQIDHDSVDVAVFRFESSHPDTISNTIYSNLFVSGMVCQTLKKCAISTFRRLRRV